MLSEKGKYVTFQSLLELDFRVENGCSISMALISNAITIYAFTIVQSYKNFKKFSK